MDANTSGVVGVAVPCLQIRFIAVQSPTYSGWLAAIAIGVLVAASNDAGPFGCLPEIQNLRAVCLFVIVGSGKSLHPVAALTVRSDHAPTAGGLIASICDTDTGTDARGVRFLSDRELEPHGPGFELCRSKAARHEIPPAGVPAVSR